LDARGESSDGEGDSQNLHKFRARIDVLNSDLHEIFDGEDQGEGEGEVEGIDITDQTKDVKLKFKKNTKP
jgi:hypothetical protein